MLIDSNSERNKAARLYAAHRKWCKAHAEHYRAIKRAAYHRAHPNAKTKDQIRAEREAKAFKTEKPCNKCKAVKPLGDFVPWKRTADGRTYQCRDCIAEYERKRYRENPSMEMERVKRWQQRNNENVKQNGQRRRVRKRGIPGSHTLQEWKMLCAHFNNRCVRCGSLEGSLTKDHIVPITKPWSSDDISNIQPLCYSCNSAKGNRYIKDFRVTAEQGIFHPAVSSITP